MVQALSEVKKGMRWEAVKRTASLAWRRVLKDLFLVWLKI